MKPLLVPFVLVLMLSGSAQGQSQSSSADPSEAAFQAAVARYLELHNRLKTEVPPLTVTANEAEISRASDMMAAAVQRARQNAQRGEIFNDGVATLIIVRLREELAGVDINRFLVSITDEPNRSDRPSVHKRYPAASSMATTPTRVLAVLPPIPAVLEYRFIGRALVLRDRDAALIIDYIADVLPAR
jgi:hypothetical protein